MSLSVVRISFRVVNARPLTATTMGYRRLATAPFIRYVGIIHPTTIGKRALSTSLIRYNDIKTNTTASTPLQNTTTATKEEAQPAAAAAAAPTSRIGKFIQQSKDLIKFYKDGIKLLWANNKEAKALQLKVKNERYVLNRSEFQLIHQSKKDMLKLIPFGFVFMILPESIPLLVIYVPGMVPRTCSKDSQIEKQREKRDKIRQKMTMNVLKSAEQVDGIAPEDFLSIPKFQKIAKHYAYDFDLSRIDRRHLESYCRFMGISDLGTQGILQKRLAKYMNYLDQDDKLLIKENIDELSIKELSHAVEERGMKSVNQEVENMRRGLKYWLSLTQPANPDHQVIPPGLLVFSRMFLLNANYGKQ